MNFSDILLVVISSAGLLHGITFAIYLGFFKKKRSVTNYLLATILVCMAFRIGKSVILNFGNNLEPIFIFAGLAFLLLIGPLLRWYTVGMTHANFKFTPYHLIESVPFLLFFLASLFVTDDWFKTNNKQVIFVFASTIIFIYLHFAFYIFIASRILKKVKKNTAKELQTKSHKAIFSWLSLLLIGFVVIWISYVINIVEETIPYIIGPIMYSVVVYFLSYKAFQLKVTDLDGTIFKKNDDAALFQQITTLITGKKLYLDPNVSLSSLSETLGKTTQKTSAVINQYAKQNFNDFINYYRIQEAKKLLLSAAAQNYTIAAIAFDSGFSSLSSFNSSFKKFEGTTPSLYRKHNL